MRAVRKRPIEKPAAPSRVFVVVGVTDVISTRPLECETTVSKPRIGDRKNVVIDTGRFARCLLFVFRRFSVLAFYLPLRTLDMTSRALISGALMVVMFGVVGVTDVTAHSLLDRFFQQMRSSQECGRRIITATCSSLESLTQIWLLCILVHWFLCPLKPHSLFLPNLNPPSTRSLLPIFLRLSTPLPV